MKTLKIPFCRTILLFPALAAILLALPLALICLADEPVAESVDLAQAGQLLLTGKYAEAEDAYQQLLPQHSESAALGLVRSYRQSGQLPKAQSALADAMKASPESAPLLTEQADMAFDRGDYETARTSINAALKHVPNLPQARWLQAELFRVQGDLPAAEKAYSWFIKQPRQQAPQSANDLYWISLGTAQHARWTKSIDDFSYLVNELLPSALEAETNLWQAHWLAGLLYAEKYNVADAATEFKSALQLNPNAAEVHVALARLATQSFDLAQAKRHVEQALSINPQLLPAHWAKADIHLANFEPRQAIEVLRAATPLHPTHEATLGRLAAACASIDGNSPDDLGPRATQIAAEVIQRNPHASEFYYEMGEAFDKLRRFPHAAAAFRLAAENLPQHTYAIGQEGLMLMRLGDEERAKKLLDASFDADPFNVRVNNQLQVLEVLEGYATLETDHFLVRYDPKYDKLLAEYAAEWLEEQYPLLCKQFGFEPKDKTLFEIFNRARNTDGHGWFSARMVGLPHIHTIGACAGQMVAMQSPTPKSPFNWARVLKHEFIHVLNLQQTNFNIPHWFTEGLATYNEGYPRPKQWNELLLSYRKQNRLFNLDNINLGFIRARNGDEWNLAYCQAELYAEFMLAEFGDDAHAKMLAAYADNLETPDAIERSFGIPVAEFEKRYTTFLNAQLDRLPPIASATKLTPAEIAKQLAAEPENPQLLAESARQKFDRKDYATARAQADAARKLDPKNQLATYVRARLHLLIGETEPAQQLAAAALDETNPQPDLLTLLAGIKLRQADYDEAARLYQLGVSLDVIDPKWLKALASVYLRANATDKLAPVLAQLAERDADDFLIRKKLAELALAAKDYEAAARWSREALFINVQDAAVHQLRGKALAGLGQTDAAEKEFKQAKALTAATP
jgi:tetratricopeptide (TPR) repeat protein